MKKIIVIISLMFMTGCKKLIEYPLKAGSYDGTPAIVKNGKPLIVIMAGQSNMAGGYNEGRITADTTRIKYVNPAGSGPIVPFANNLIAKNPGINLIVVSCPLSGTYISQWAPGGLIESCISSAKAEYPAGIIAGFIFLQGESDAKWGETYTGTTYDWAMAFTAIARHVRAKLGSSLPVVLARISRTELPGFPAWPHVRKEQDSVNLDHLAHISTDGVGLIDGIHYDQAGYAVVGQRMADALYGLWAEI